MPQYRNLLPGDPAPWFFARANTRTEFAFDATGGRYVVLCFFATADARGRSAVEAAFAAPGLFDDDNAAFFGVSIDPADEAEKRVVGRLPGFRFFWDFDGEISRIFGVITADADKTRGGVQPRRSWLVLAPTWGVLNV